MLKVGDLVYHCVRWSPGRKTKNEYHGVGIVTMVIIKGEAQKARVMWKNGNIAWLDANNLVDKEKIIGNAL